MALMDSPTDVLLQTTDHFGPTFWAMHNLSDIWISAIVPGKADLALVFDAYLDVYDEFEAGPFAAAHGWYRQATAGLRDALGGSAPTPRLRLPERPGKDAASRHGGAPPPKSRKPA